MELPLKQVRFVPVFPEMGDDYVFGRPVEYVDAPGSETGAFAPGTGYKVRVDYKNPATGEVVFSTEHLVQIAQKGA